jgi:hypothetical protein
MNKLIYAIVSLFVIAIIALIFGADRIRPFIPKDEKETENLGI